MGDWAGLDMGLYEKLVEVLDRPISTGDWTED